MKRVATTVAVCLLAMAAVVSPASGHGMVPGVAVIVDANHVPGLTVTVGATATEYIHAAYTGTSAMDVLDDAGQPFLRFDPSGVEANLASAMWYRSNSTLHDARTTSGATGWLRVSDTPAWTWFDGRMHDSSTAQQLTAGRSYGEWSIPVTIGGVRYAVAGHHEYQPSTGLYQATVHAGATGLAVDGIAGGPPVGLLARVAGAAPIVILGAGGEPLAKGDAHGWAVNAASPSWLLDGDLHNQAVAGVVDASAPARWLSLGSSTTFVWNDPRIQPAETWNRPARAPAPLHWSIPVEIGGVRGVLAGVTTWVSTVPAPRSGGRSIRVPVIAGLAGLGVAGLLIIDWRRRRRA